MPNIKSLDVLLEGHHIGTLYEDASGKHTFTYNLSASNSDLAQLSLSMPRHVEPWTGLPVEAYIDGVLPDSADVRQRIARQYGVNARNPFSLLTAVGLDRSGAVQFVAPQQKDLLPQSSIVPLTKSKWENASKIWLIIGKHRGKIPANTGLSMARRIRLHCATLMTSGIQPKVPRPQHISSNQAYMNCTNTHSMNIYA